MINSNTLFYAFSAALLLSAFMVVFSRHSVFSLLFLISSFLFSSFLLLLLECEFLALLFIVVYAGAIAVLFLFAIMMLESKSVNLTRNTMKYLPVSLFFIVLFFFLLVVEVNSLFSGLDGIQNSPFFGNAYINWYDLIDSTTDIEVYGQILYSYFVLQFLLAGLILLLVLIGVVQLTNVYNNQTRDQSTFKQLSRRAKFFYNK